MSIVDEDDPLKHCREHPEVLERLIERAEKDGREYAAKAYRAALEKVRGDQS